MSKSTNKLLKVFEIEQIKKKINKPSLKYYLVVLLEEL